ncbi:homocysteine S-methyltransferase 1-like [Sesamum indicum]|uniref:Homocysteine S-methyltransferase 1-like n=1 Tax=Sesamum indicum TaxID=4182 RepID=A0A6I9TCP2_SESIN|nr:homocysteine S-methyltransferase 1-like [Sesamum indicum]
MRFGIKALKRNSLSACHFAHGIEAEREAICSSNQALKDFRQVWGQLLLVTGDQGVRHSTVDGVKVSSGESCEECFDIINKSSKVSAVGINCAPPNSVLSLIKRFKERTAKVIVVYPNSGETRDGTAKTWQPSKCVHDEFELLATTWRNAGAKLIGGCCRTTPSTIRSISRVLKDN